MRLITTALLFASASIACAQTSTPPNPCAANVSSSLPESSGCMPLTYKPADGGPERTIMVPVEYIYPQGHSVPVPPTASRLLEFQAGVFGAYNTADYGTTGNIDAGVYASLMARHFGIQVDAADTVDSRAGVREAYVVAGPRFQMRYKPLTIYAKAQAGVARFSATPAPRLNNKDTSAVEQFGGGVEINATRNLRIRVVDYSYQIWPEFNPRNLSPQIVSAGVAFHF
ncbi:outer membrane beta-barrel protein [Granulicella tundricola]|uniref:Outer membrane protein beta-barrel domain-containing protein n=1 Tax=Granulicella tundricola (strain ATCC BAA-1859 / DSM 23138 / MP5ACTX9) TaxID=1198114 RepID=E8WY31_GRATM|nr:outer membrane beta-barrel protein [Granulicella tundricola]ADW67570.1 hypothetical protein AciX9_0498 [Granulicella tundricola MP5ACTX9]